MLSVKNNGQQDTSALSTSMAMIADAARAVPKDSTFCKSCKSDSDCKMDATGYVAGKTQYCGDFIGWQVCIASSHENEPCSWAKCDPAQPLTCNAAQICVKKTTTAPPIMWVDLNGDCSGPNAQCQQIPGPGIKCRDGYLPGTKYCGYADEGDACATDEECGVDIGHAMVCRGICTSYNRAHECLTSAGCKKYAPYGTKYCDRFVTTPSGYGTCLPVIGVGEACNTAKVDSCGPGNYCNFGKCAVGKRSAYPGAQTPSWKENR